MPFNKISGFANLPAGSYPMSLPAGTVFMLPSGQGVVGYGAATFGVSQLYPQLASGNTLTGQYMIGLGQYTVLQAYDQNLNYWKNVQVPPLGYVTISSDGQNWRIANSTGTPVGALITAAGTAGVNGFYGYVNSYNNSGNAVTIINGATTSGNTVFTITPSAGGSTWNAIVGGAINTTISFSGSVFQSQGGVLSPFGGTGTTLTASAGSNYVRPPIILFAPPPNQGGQPYVLPAATCTISGGAINAVTVTQQGAGLLGLPSIVVVNAPGDTTGGGALLGWTSGNSSQVGSGTVTLMWPSYYGTALTAVPTFTYGGTANPAPTATAIMNWTITAFGGTAGAGYGTTPGGVVFGGIVSGTAAYTNPLYDKAMSIPIPPPINVATGTGVPTLAGPFGGVNFQAAAVYAAIPNGTAAPTTANANTPTMGGASDTFYLISL